MTRPSSNPTPTPVTEKRNQNEHRRSNDQILNSMVGFIHHHFLLILISAYATAAILPGFGLWLRCVQFGQVVSPTGTIKISLSLLMLSFLLLNAGLGIKAQELTGLFKHPLPIISGFAANTAVPIVLVLSMRTLMQLWHSNDEIQNLLVGLAMICAMPIAGSSTAWSQNANGNISLSLGLVFLSTILSPFTTPVVLNLFSNVTTGDYSSDLHEIANQGTNAFMMLTVVLPSLLGMGLFFVCGERFLNRLKPSLKMINYIVLLLLNYSNACTALPNALQKPDFDFLFLIVLSTGILCLTAFSAGWLISKVLKTNKSDQAALMFGLGMNNNGTGLVLAAATLSDHPAVMLPMIFYTLIQQIFAAIVDLNFFKNEPDSAKT